MSIANVVIQLILLSLTPVQSYPYGAPCAAFDTMQPSVVFHGPARNLLTELPPYEFSVIDSNGNAAKFYKLNTTYTVRLKGLFKKFRGFLIQARLANYDNSAAAATTSKRVGRFLPDITWGSKGIQLQDCEETRKYDSVTHSNNEPKDAIELLWQPAFQEGPVQFVVTIVEEVHNFWENWQPQSGYLFLAKAEHMSSKESVADSLDPFETTTGLSQRFFTSNTRTLNSNSFVIDPALPPSLETTTTVVTFVVNFPEVTVAGEGQRNSGFFEQRQGGEASLRVVPPERPPVQQFFVPNRPPNPLIAEGFRTEKQSPIFATTLSTLTTVATTPTTTTTPTPDRTTFPEISTRKQFIAIDTFDLLTRTTIGLQQSVSSASSNVANFDGFQKPDITIGNKNVADANAGKFNALGPQATDNKITSVNPCLSFPCYNNATCKWRSEENTYECVCTERWLGVRCDVPNYCYKHNCRNGGTCVNEENKFSCTCPSNFAGDLCQHHCPDYLCAHGGRCVVAPNQFFACVCTPGWTGEHCREDIDECTSNPCKFGRCINKPNGYQCQCPEGLMGVNCHSESNKGAAAFAPVLEPLLFLLGKWTYTSSNSDMFPINFGRKFVTYKKDLEFLPAAVNMFGASSVKYRSMAVSSRNALDIRVSQGFLTLIPRGDVYKIALYTTGNEGVTILEEGSVKDAQMLLKTTDYFSIQNDTLEEVAATVSRTIEFVQPYLRETVERVSSDNVRFIFSSYYRLVQSYAPFSF